jgi:hypothetical protein
VSWGTLEETIEKPLWNMMETQCEENPPKKKPKKKKKFHLTPSQKTQKEK